MPAFQKPGRLGCAKNVPNRAGDDAQGKSTTGLPKVALCRPTELVKRVFLLCYVSNRVFLLIFRMRNFISIRSKLESATGRRIIVILRNSMLRYTSNGCTTLAPERGMIFNGISSAIFHFNKKISMNCNGYLFRAVIYWPWKAFAPVGEQYGHKKGQLSRDRNRLQVLLLQKNKYSILDSID